MKNLPFLALSFIIAFVISIITVIIVAFFNYRYTEIDFTNIVYIFLFSFLSSLLIIVSILYFFIYNRIFRIFEKVSSFRNKINKSEPVQFDQDVISELNYQVSALEEERKSEVEQLRKLELYRKEFLANVSHELKTPVFNIQGYVLTLLDGGLEDKKINRDYLIRAEKNIDRMIAMIDDLEAITQLEKGELELDIEKFDLIPLIKDVMHALDFRATSKAVILSLDYTLDKPVYVVADRFRIRQVFTNLIVNSIKYGKEYGETKIRLVEKENSIVVEVADNGIGIAKEHLPRLFERFYRVDKTRSREQGGTGLGLAIVKHIIEAHQQTIYVTSTEGVGTTFSFALKKAEEVH